MADKIRLLVRPIAVAECKYPEAGVALTGADGRVVHSIRNKHSNLALLHRLSGRNQQSQRDCKLTFRDAIPSIRYFAVGSCLPETNKISTFGPMVFFSSGTFMAPGPPDATNT
jgi:hypothetical protein